MAKNLMSEVVRMFGVELGEEFKVVYKTGFEIICNFTKEGVFVHKGDSGRYEKELLADIICGKAEIVKLPWQPKKNNKYWSFWINNENTMTVYSYTYENSITDILIKEKGWVYRSRIEAEAALHKVAAEVGVEYEL